MDPPSSKPVRFLVVDDNQETRQVLTQMIRSLAWSAESAATGDEALQRLSDDNQPRLDIVVLDSVMPGRSGFEAMLEIRKLVRPEARPFLVLASNLGLEGNPATLESEEGSWDGYLAQADHTLGPGRSGRRSLGKNPDVGGRDAGRKDPSPP